MGCQHHIYFVLQYVHVTGVNDINANTRNRHTKKHDTIDKYSNISNLNIDIISMSGWLLPLYMIHVIFMALNIDIVFSNQ